MGIGEVLRDEQLSFPFWLVSLILVAQQLSGINAVFFYSTGIFSAAGVGDPLMATLLTSFVNAASTAAVLPLVEAQGRRPLLLWGGGGMAVCAVAMCAALEQKAGAAAVAAVLGYICFFELGLGAVPWMLGGEVFPHNAKEAALAAASGLNWAANFVVGLLFPLLQARLGPLSFLPFAFVLAATTAALWALLPETKGRDPLEIVELMHLNKRTALAALQRIHCAPHASAPHDKKKGECRS